MWISDLKETINQESNTSTVTNRVGTLHCGDCLDIMKEIPDDGLYKVR